MEQKVWGFVGLSKDYEKVREIGVTKWYSEEGVWPEIREARLSREYPTGRGYVLEVR